MGGFGSGRSGWRPVAEHLHSIDVNKFNREGILQHWRGTWAWWDSDGERTGSVSLNIGFDQIHATGTLSDEPWDQTITLSWTPCNFGGSRPWFNCPSWRCNRRVGKLYIGGSGFACRTCYRLVHASTREDAVGRIWRKKGKLEARLGEDGEKPKGMHWRTYERICDQLDDLEGELDSQFIIGAARILGW